MGIVAAPCGVLLVTLGRSTNLSEPWAPRKDTSRSLLHFLQKCCKTLCNFKLFDIEFELLALVRSSLKLNAAISDSQIGGLRTTLAEDQKWGGPRMMVAKTQYLAMHLWFRSRTAWHSEGLDTSKRVEFTGVNGLAVRLQKLHFMTPLFVNV